MAGDGVDIDLYDNLEEGFDQVQYVDRQRKHLSCFFIYVYVYTYRLMVILHAQP